MPYDYRLEININEVKDNEENDKVGEQAGRGDKNVCVGCIDAEVMYRCDVLVGCDLNRKFSKNALIPETLTIRDVE